MSAFRFRRLAIRRAPGVDPFDLDDLAGGINLVYGPNGSGKTTTARALQALLWPRDVPGADRVHHDATAALGDEMWSLRLDAGHAEYQREGIRATRAPVTSPDARDRYALSLPDLLREEDRGLARAILIESSGGYDLEAAAKRLEPRRPHHRQRPQQEKLRAAVAHVRDARAAQEGLAREAEALAAKEASLRDRPRLEARLRQLRLAADHVDRAAEAEHAAARVGEFAPVLQRLRGDEDERLRGFRDTLAERRGVHARAEEKCRGARRDIERLALADAVATGDLLPRLNADLERLQEIDREVDAQTARAREARSRLEQEETPLGSIADPSLLEALDLERLGGMVEAARALDDARAMHARLAGEFAGLPELAPEPSAAGEGRLPDGILLLRQWLAAGRATGDEAPRLRRALLVSVALLGAAGIGLAVSGMPVVGGALFLAALAFLLFVLRSPAPPDERGSRERDYHALGIHDRPEAWDPEHVGACLDRLERRLAENRERQRFLELRRTLERRLVDAEARVADATSRLAATGENVGLRLEIDAFRLGWLVDRISRWQRARIERGAAEQAVAASWTSHSEVLASANDLLASIGLPAVTHARALRGGVEKLRNDLARWQELQRELRDAVREVKVAAQEIERAEAEVRALLSGAGIEEGDEARLADWCGQVAAYREAVREREVAEAQCRTLAARFEETGPADADLLGADGAALRGRIAETEAELDRLVDLGQEVGALRSRVERAKEGHALEEALAEEARCREALLDLRLRDLRAGVAAVLVEHIERETRHEHLPEVFHRADHLFNRLTHGAYELRVEPGDPPAFRAYDTRRQSGLDLDQLSGGTRVQLLLAVRLAFVEAQESGVKLPLLLDETLANSDDARAAAVMDALVELAADGRQIFYFTAQPGEVEKWKCALEARADVEWRAIDLGSVRRLQRRVPAPALIPPVPPPPPAAPPAGMSHTAFGAELDVPRIDLHAPVGGLHLWYLIEDVLLLHRLTADLRMERWGQLESFLARGGRRLLEGDAGERTATLARVATAVLERLRIGRGRPLDRQALLVSGAVSTRFIDEVDALVRAVGGEASALLEGLEKGAVVKFQRRNIEALREFFEAEGHLDPREPLDRVELRRHVLADTAELFAGGEVDYLELDRLLARILAGCGLASGASPDAEAEASAAPGTPSEPRADARRNPDGSSPQPDLPL